MYIHIYVLHTRVHIYIYIYIHILQKHLHIRIYMYIYIYMHACILLGGQEKAFGFDPTPKHVYHFCFKSPLYRVPTDPVLRSLRPCVAWSICPPGPWDRGRRPRSASPCSSGLHFHSVKMSTLKVRVEVSLSTCDFTNPATRNGRWEDRGHGVNPFRPFIPVLLESI